MLSAQQKAEGQKGESNWCDHIPYDCDRCGAPATANVQKMWVLWPYDHKNDSYDKMQAPWDFEPEESHHFCESCLEKWEEGR